MRIATRCRTVSDFTAMFRRYVTRDAIFVPGLGMRAIGFETELKITLGTGATVMSGRGVVREAWATSANPFRLPGLLLGITALTVRSKQLFDGLRPAAPSQEANEDDTEPHHTPWSAFGDEHTLLGPPIAPRLPPPPGPRPLRTISIPPPTAAAAPSVTLPRTRTGNVVPRRSTSITRRYPTVTPPLGQDEVAVVEARGESFSQPTRVATPIPPMVAPSPCAWQADTVLPANPLWTLSDADLAGLVECSLYEVSADAQPPAPPSRHARLWIGALVVLVMIGLVLDRETSASRPATHSTLRIDGLTYTVDVVLTRSEPTRGGGGGLARMSR